MLLDRCDDLTAVADRRDDLEVGSHTEQELERLAEDLVVLDEEDPDRPPHAGADSTRPREAGGSGAVRRPGRDLDAGMPIGDPPEQAVERRPVLPDEERQELPRLLQELRDDGVRVVVEAVAAGHGLRRPRARATRPCGSRPFICTSRDAIVTSPVATDAGALRIASAF